MAQKRGVVSVGIAEKTCEVAFTGFTGHANYSRSLGVEGYSSSYLVMRIRGGKNKGSRVVCEGGEEEWGLFGNFRGFFGFVSLLDLANVRVLSLNSSRERDLL